MATIRAALLAPLCLLLLGAPGRADEPRQKTRAAQHKSKHKSARKAPNKRAPTPSGFAELFVVGVIPGEDGNTVLLTDEPRERFVPLGIGGSEALSIHIRLENRKFPRPLTHDLLDSVMRELGGKLVKVQIDDLRDDVFLGAVYVEARGRTLRFDARPSDAIALALGSDVPIFIKRHVLEQVGFRPEDVPEPEDEPEEVQPVMGAERTYTL